MPDWEDLRHLASLAKAGSLSAAARALGVEHATVARRIAALEAETGLRLVDRRARRLLLTPEGERLAAIASRMEGEAQAADRLARAARGGIFGRVTISAPPALAAARFADALVTLQGEHPGLEIHVRGEKREAALDRREADIAVRLSRPEAGDLTILKIGEIAFCFCASAAYLEATAPPDWRFIAYGDGTMTDAAQTKRLKVFAAGRPIRFLANTSEMQLAAARAGGGIAILPDFQRAEAPELVVIDDGAEPLRRDIWLVVHADLRTSPAVRAVAEALKSALSGDHVKRQPR
jgi:DNA-binding transcriptional LysR family regulator